MSSLWPGYRRGWEVVWGPKVTAPPARKCLWWEASTAFQKPIDFLSHTPTPFPVPPSPLASPPILLFPLSISPFITNTHTHLTLPYNDIEGLSLASEVGRGPRCPTAPLVGQAFGSSSWQGYGAVIAQLVGSTLAVLVQVSSSWPSIFLIPAAGCEAGSLRPLRLPLPQTVHKATYLLLELSFSPRHVSHAFPHGVFWYRDWGPHFPLFSVYILMNLTFI